MANTIQHKRGTAAQWSSLNPLLANGELGLETDTHKFKFGDGVNYWNTLDYAGGGGGDLSNYYTKAEVNSLLSEKEDSFTTEVPLDLSTLTLGGIYHITVGSRIVNDYQQALTFDSSSSGVVAISNSAISNSPNTLSEFFTGNCSYFDIPTTFGSRISTAESNVNDKIWLNCGAVDSSYYPMFIWGYKDTNDEFTPVVFQRGYYTGGMFSGFVDSVSNVDTNTINLNCTTYSDTSNSASGGSGVGYNAWLSFNPSTQTLSPEIDRQNNSTYYWNGCQTQDVNKIAEAKKINTVRVFAWMNGGFPPASAEYLINGVDSGWSINDEAQTSTILSLKYDNSTITLNSNNELQALGSRNIGEVVTSTIPLTDAGLHLLDGSLISGSGIYSAFVDYMADKHGSTEVAWTQPVLTSNGTLGGDTFAVYASNSYDGTTYPIYKSFDNDSSTIWYSSATPVDVIFYNPKPLKVTKIQCQNRSDANNYAFTAGTVYGSNDNVTYTQLGTFTNNVTSQGGSWNIDLSSNTGSYLYYKVSFSSATQAGTGANFTITATYINYPDYFCTEEQWQTAVTTYGACDKYVYDSVNNTVRIPKRNSEHGDLIQSYQSGNNWYRIYSDGWCEQGGYIAYTTDYAMLTINFLKPFINTNYDFSRTWHSTYTTSAPAQCAMLGYNTKSTNSITIQGSVSPYGAGSDWQACGYIDISGYQYSPIYEYIVLATTIKTEIEVDIDEIATDLNGKADVDLTNINNTAKIAIAHNAMPSGTYVDLTVGASGTTYTAPADGWFCCDIAAFNSSCEMYYGKLHTTSWVGGDNYAGIIMPVCKGGVVELYYSQTPRWFVFVYAKGSESEAN